MTKLFHITYSRLPMMAISFIVCKPCPVPMHLTPPGTSPTSSPSLTTHLWLTRAQTMIYGHQTPSNVIKPSHLFNYIFPNPWVHNNIDNTCNMWIITTRHMLNIVCIQYMNHIMISMSFDVPGPK